MYDSKNIKTQCHYPMSKYCGKTVIVIKFVELCFFGFSLTSTKVSDDGTRGMKTLFYTFYRHCV